MSDRCALVLLALAACSSREVASGNGGGAESGNGTSESTSSVSTEGSPTSCDQFMDDEAPASVSMLVRNLRPQPIHLGVPVACANEYFEVRSLVEGMPGRWSGSHCPLSCETVIEGDCWCAAECPTVQLIRIEPGGEYPLEWGGMVLDHVDFPPECAHVDCPTDSCSVGRQAVAGGSYEVMLGLVSMPSCEGCSCTPNPEGWCPLDSYDDWPDEYPTYAFEWPAEPVLVVD